RANRQTHAAWHNAPVPAFGSTRARLLVVGLAPGLRGANQSGRPFTGDAAGDLLYPALLRHELARGSYGARPDDGLELIDCRITNAVRCVPPENKPVAAEINTCREFLRAELAGLPELRLVLVLGTIAHNSVLAALDLKRRDHPFGHAARYDLGAGRELMASYHCSRYNVNTGRLTPEMFDAVFATIRRTLDSRAP
ncbi:MAG: uracil-DNA glycosylase, partial [Alphaproteobacteria bacterium]|nr:uracil-DNA glycosylase [Alphaproteobacteria bacterium]